MDDPASDTAIRLPPPAAAAPAAGEAAPATPPGERPVAGPAEAPPILATGPPPMPGPTVHESRKVQGQPVPEASVMPLVHYYRAEVARSTAWRSRMDTTTNWAIFSTTAIISFAYSDPKMPHLVIPLGGVMVLLLMCIEARRYRFYDVWRRRTRLLEAHFMVPYLLPEHTLLQGNWREALAEDLILPTFKLSFWRAAASRLRRNYIWLFLILFGSWVMRILLFASPDNLRQFYAALSIGSIPSWAVASGVLGVHVFLGVWMIAAGTSEDPDVLVYKRMRGRAGAAWLH